MTMLASLSPAPWPTICSPVLPILHGEIVAINDYVGRHGNQGWADGILYTTGEPCPMCMSAIVWAGIGGVIYGSSITTLAEADIPQIMIGASVVRDAAPFYRRQIMGGALRAETNMLLRNRPIADGAEAC